LNKEKAMLANLRLIDFNEATMLKEREELTNCKKKKKL
jgi:hypothetical protein